MISKASVQFIRISPRKVRYVIDLIRKKKVAEAQAILNGSPRRAGEIIKKLLNQAVDAAEKNSQVPSSNLMVSKVLADGGPTMKRFRAASMGRAGVIRKRTSHITLELDLIKKGAVVPAAPAKVSKSTKIHTTKEAKAGSGSAKKRGGLATPKMAGAK